MDLENLALAISLIARIMIWVIIASALLSYVLAPYHPLREALDRIVEPLLNPIRRILPQTGMIDFSPLVLIILIEILSRILVALLLSS